LEPPSSCCTQFIANSLGKIVNYPRLAQVVGNRVHLKQ
jgi:hypothetical protein